jgi:hypothetical protein
METITLAVALSGLAVSLVALAVAVRGARRS